MNLLLGKIWSNISSTLQKEELRPKRENLRITSKDDKIFIIEIRRRFLWVFKVWVDTAYTDGGNPQPLTFNSLESATYFINYICED